MQVKVACEKQMGWQQIGKHARYSPLLVSHDNTSPSVTSAASECGLLFRRELPLSREGASLVGRGDSGTDIAAALSGGEAGKEHTFTSFTYIPNLPYNTY